MERKGKSSIGNIFFVHHRILPAVKRVDFVSDRMLYVVLRGHWCIVIVPNVHAKSEEKNDYSNDGLYEDFPAGFRSSS
jgi:hypothetical protein